MTSRTDYFAPHAPHQPLHHPGSSSQGGASIPMSWQAGPGPGGGFDDFGQHGGGPSVYRPPQQPGDEQAPFNDLIYGAGSGFIRSGLGAYGERMFGSGRDFVQANVNRYFSAHDMKYYFQVNDQYVKNKLKVLLCPFLHRGHWTRIAEQVAGGLTYKPPRHDINAPDLYIPLMAFVSYLIIGGFAVGLEKRFTPTVMSSRFTRGFFGWCLEALFLRGLLSTIGGSADAPLLDLLAYSGYPFVGIALAVAAWTIWHHAYYPVIIWTSLCSAIFLVKTMKRVLFSESRSYSQETSLHHYSLIGLAVLQFPLALWLGRL
eukprot:TRINITY_DN37299_c0_g1_i1.p1 TRINITY_DN37299_c0_g1~~TRINITY_DN37299_c0_g1_i1.p1  ORF type:complete len:316 (+),score=39.54 TRINITY_DN37299_c0_g1_i1:213-1160(+)